MTKHLFPFLMGATLMVVPVIASAARMDAVVAPIAIPAGENYSGNDWSATNKVPGIKWSHQGLKETPAAPFNRFGKTKLDGLGNAAVHYNGMRTMMEGMDVTLGSGMSQPVDPSDFDKVVKSQFAGSQLAKVRGACKDEGGASGSSVYQITLTGKKPVYLMVMTDAGGSMPDRESTIFEFSLEKQERWACTR